MEEKVVLEVVVSNPDEINELVQDPKVYGESLKFLIEHLRVSRNNSENVLWKGEDYNVLFLL